MRLALTVLLVLMAVPVALLLSAAYAAAVGADIGSSVACGARGECRELNLLYGSAKGWQFSPFLTELEI